MRISNFMFNKNYNFNNLPTKTKMQNFNVITSKSELSFYDLVSSKLGKHLTDSKTSLIGEDNIIDASSTTYPINKDQNSINLDPNTVYNFGTTKSGKEIKIRFFPEGGFETNYAPLMPPIKSDKVSDYDLMVIKQINSISITELHGIERKATNLAHILYAARTGKVWRDWSNGSEKDLRKELQQFGVDTDKDIHINGKAYKLENNRLVINENKALS